MKVNNEQKEQSSIKDDDSKQRKETNLNTSWHTIVDTTPQPNILKQIITSDQSSLSSLTENTPEKKRGNKKNKVDEFLKSWEIKASTNPKRNTLQPKESITSLSSMSPSSIIRNYKNNICQPLFTKKKSKLIRIPMKTISYTYQCGHIKIIKYPPNQKQVAKTTTTKSSRRRHFSYFKCKQQTLQTTTNYSNEKSKET